MPLMNELTHFFFLQQRPVLERMYISGDLSPKCQINCLPSCLKKLEASHTCMGENSSQNKAAVLILGQKNGLAKLA